MTARIRGNHKAAATQLRVSPELQAVFTLMARIFGEQGVHTGHAVESLRTISALVLCKFRSDEAANILLVDAGVVRARVYRIRQRVMDCLRETDFVLPVRPSVGQNLERWDPSTFDEHVELSTVERDDDKPHDLC